MSRTLPPSVKVFSLQIYTTYATPVPVAFLLPLEEQATITICVLLYARLDKPGVGVVVSKV